MARRWPSVVAAVLAALLLLVGVSGESAVVHASPYTYDAQLPAPTDARGPRLAESENGQVTAYRAAIDDRSANVSGAPTTPSLTLVATNNGGYDLYHGTDADSAQDIVENGLSQESAGNLGGGDVFWVTTSLGDAKFFSQANPADGPPAVVGIDLPAGVAAAIRSGLLEPVAGLPGAYTVKDWSRFNSSARFGIAC